MQLLQANKQANNQSIYIVNNVIIIIISFCVKLWNNDLIMFF